MKKNESIDYLIHKIDNKIKTNIDNHFKVHDLTFSQSQVLHLLSTNGGTVSQKQLQTMMNVSHPTMVGLVQRLEANGFVKTEPDCADRRNKLVSTTEAALKFREEMISSGEKFRNTMLDGIDEEELVTVTKVLNKMLSNIENRKGVQYVKNSDE
ncbi:MAG: MarR family transcriptional regulator [Erysipelotrichaceae bacterium]|nr:MarR family transcriptional regulator [Erysipelotrichaceae bacterium]